MHFPWEVQKLQQIAQKLMKGNKNKSQFAWDLQVLTELKFLAIVFSSAFDEWM